MTHGAQSVCALAVAAAAGDEASLAALRARLERHEGRYVIAVDFDGTLCHEKYPEIGEPFSERIAALKLLRELGARVILWTCREEDDLFDALDWTREQGLAFDAINDNTEEIKELFNWNSRKVFADEYWDDKAFQADPPGWTRE